MEKDNQSLDEKQKNDSKDPFFYFNLADKSHEKIVQKEDEKLEKDPLAPVMREISEVEY